MTELTRLQVLILDSAKFCSNPTYWLIEENKDEQATWYGYPFLFEKDEIAEGLFDLCSRGFISLDSDDALIADDYHYKGEYQIHNPDRDTVRNALVYDAKAAYRLTPEGGAAWEKAVNANWEHYICNVMLGKGGVAPTAMEITTTSMAYANLAVLNKAAAGYREIEGSREESVLEPWQVMYWKTLPIGHRIQFRFLYDPSHAIPNSWKLLPQWFDRKVLGFE